MTPEAKARVGIDALLLQAGWHVCNMADANIHAARGVALREFRLNEGYGVADYLLYVDGKAAGVIEAKKEGSTLVLGVAEKPIGLVWEDVPDAAQLRTALWRQLNDGQNIGVNLLRDDDAYRL